MVGWFMNNELEESRRGLVEILSRHLFVRIDENCENFSQNSLCSGRDSSWEHLPDASLARYRNTDRLGLSLLLL
jgi:hypothetical protein